MKSRLKLIIIIIGMLLLALNLFAQTDDPFVGSWKFDVNKKIDYNAMLDTAKVHGYNISDESNRKMLFVSIAAIVISRCEHSTLTISPFENTVMLRTQRYNDPTAEDTQWGKWIKLSEGRYMIEFGNRTEYYRLNEITNEFYLERNPNFSLTTELLKDNLKLVKKGD